MTDSPPRRRHRRPVGVFRRVATWLRCCAVWLLVACLAMPPGFSHAAAILISGYMPNPASTDSPYEYVQLVATQDIDFSVNNYSVVFADVANTSSPTTNGWVSGGAVTYGFNLTSGTVSAGQVFYVGGSGMLINGAGSASLADETWIRAINTSAAGDGFGTGNSAGVLGNGGPSADGLAVFAGATNTLTASSIPIDALFYGTGVGGAKPATGGFKMPDNDYYTSTGVFGDTGNDHRFGQPLQTQFISLAGDFNTTTNTWTTARTATAVESLTSADIIASALLLNGDPVGSTGPGDPGGDPPPPGKRIWDVGTGVWDTTTANWTGADTLYIDGQPVEFGPLTDHAVVTIAAGNVSPSETQVLNDSFSYTFTGGSILSGALHKTGAGSLVLDSANGFTGVFLTGGVLETRVSGALGGGIIDLGNNLNSTLSVTTSSQTINNEIAWGIMTVATIDVADGITLLRDGGIDFFGGTENTLHKTGAGAWVFSGAAGTFDDFKGGIFIDAGLLQNQKTSGSFFSPTWTTVTIAQGATWDESFADGEVIGGLAGGGTVLFRSGQEFTFGPNNASTEFSGTITGGTNGVVGATPAERLVNVVKRGIGTTTLSGNTSDYAGLTHVRQGVLSITNLADRGLASAIGLGNFHPGATADVLLGTLGNTIQGTLRYTGASVASDRAIELAGTVAGGGGVIDVALEGTVLTLNGAINNASGQVGHLAKAGDGTLRLAANSNYTGGTVVSAGRFEVASGVTLSGTTSVQVHDGAELVVRGTLDSTAGVTILEGGRLAGDGLLLDHVTLNTGATIAPGTSPGTQTVSQLTLAAGSRYELEINDVAGADGTNWDLLVVTGSLDISGLSSSNPFVVDLVSLNAANLPGVADNWDFYSDYAWRFLQYGSLTGTFDSNLFDVSTAQFQHPLSGTFSVVVGDSLLGQDASALYVQYTAVPEPGSLTLVAVAAALAFRKRISATICAAVHPK